MRQRDGMKCGGGWDSEVRPGPGSHALTALISRGKGPVDMSCPPPGEENGSLWGVRGGRPGPLTGGERPKGAGHGLRPSSVPSCSQLLWPGGSPSRQERRARGAREPSLRPSSRALLFSAPCPILRATTVCPQQACAQEGVDPPGRRGMPLPGGPRQGRRARPQPRSPRKLSSLSLTPQSSAELSFSCLPPPRLLFTLL